MKQLFTLLSAACLMIVTSTASAQFSNHEGRSSLKKARERVAPAEHPLKIREGHKAVQLKNAAVVQHPTSAKLFNWIVDDWYLQQEMLYDAQGREIQMVSGHLKVLTEYDDVEDMVTKWYQQRDNEVAPWITYMKEINKLSGDWSFEIWQLIDGQLIITGGSKSTHTVTTQDNTTTEQWEYWSYNTELKDYERNSAYKDEILVNDGGQTLSYKGYYWEDDQWVLEYTDTYTYNSENILTEMTFCYYEEGFTECERLEFIFSGAGAPESAWVYMDEGTGYELTGRYINLVWNDWENVSFDSDDESVVLNATMQLILDPNGDINSDANYVNFEHFEYDENGNYTHQYWMNEQWVTDDYYHSETDGNGDLVTTAYYFDYEGGIDEDCNLFLMGEKEISVLGPTHSSFAEYEWTKTSEPCGYEWVKSYESIENWTTTSHENITRSMQAETTMENTTFEEWDAYGHPVKSISTTTIGETMADYAEYSYNNTYDGALRTSTITSFRDEPEGTFTPTVKMEYAYGAITSIPNGTTVPARVFPTVFKEGFNVSLSDVSALKLISAQGQTVWQQALATGQIFVPGSHLPQGIYILLITNDAGNRETVKLLKR